MATQLSLEDNLSRLMETSEDEREELPPFKKSSKVRTTKTSLTVKCALQEAELNRLYKLLEPSAKSDMEKVVASVYNNEVDIRSALSAYNKEWFDSLLWPPYIKKQLAISLNDRCLSVLGSESDIWSRIGNG